MGSAVNFPPAFTKGETMRNTFQTLPKTTPASWSKAKTMLSKMCFRQTFWPHLSHWLSFVGFLQPSSPPPASVEIAGQCSSAPGPGWPPPWAKVSWFTRGRLTSVWGSALIEFKICNRNSSNKSRFWEDSESPEFATRINERGLCSKRINLMYTSILAVG